MQLSLDPLACADCGLEDVNGLTGGRDAGRCLHCSSLYPSLWRKDGPWMRHGLAGAADELVFGSILFGFQLLKGG